MVPKCNLLFTVQSQKDKDAAEEFVCPEGTQGNGNFADPATCRRFYQVSCDHYKYVIDIFS